MGLSKNHLKDRVPAFQPEGEGRDEFADAQLRVDWYMLSADVRGKTALSLRRSYLLAAHHSFVLEFRVQNLSYLTRHVSSFLSDGLEASGSRL